MKRIKLLLSLAVLCALPSALRAQTFTQGDILLVSTQSAVHDSTNCNSWGTVTYNITISNSYLDDTVKIVDMTNQVLLHVEVNTTGTATWNFQYSAPLVNGGFLGDYEVQNNIAMFFGNTLKVISDVDTIYNLNNTFMFPVSDPCTYGPVSGRVYVDNNSDCVYNTGDHPLGGVFVFNTVNNGTTTTLQSISAITDTGGHYNMWQVQESWMTDFVVFMNPLYQFTFPLSLCNPGSFTFTTVPQTNVDFSLQCSGNIDLEVGAGSPGTVRPNIPFYMDPYASNTGCDTVGGTLTLVKDPMVAYNALLSTYPADYVSGDTLKWYYGGMSNLYNGGPYWNAFMSAIHLTPDPSLSAGDTVCFRVYTDLPLADINLNNNDQHFCLNVVNSYDPNVKEVAPKGEGVIGGIPPTTPDLTYTIHFQNTGNAAALNVSVLDTLDADVDPLSFKILGSSHSMMPQWVAPGVVKFNFDNIMLPDSGSNEAASHGYVKFRVNLDPNLSIGTQIKNTAHIFFDSNPAIVTNTALNTIAWPQSVASVNNNANISVFPNPANDNIFISSKDALEGKAYLSNIGGQLISTVSLSGSSTSVDVSKLPAGIYMLKIVSTTGTSMQKFTKQ